MDQDPFEAFAPAAAGDLAFIKRLKESQWWRPDELLAHQLKLLLPLLRHASATIPFYRSRIEDAGIDLGAPLRLEDWRRLPKLSRREVQQSPERLASNAVPETHGSQARPTCRSHDDARCTGPNSVGGRNARTAEGLP